MGGDRPHHDWGHDHHGVQVKKQTTFKKTAAVIAAHNEEAHIQTVVRAVKKHVSLVVVVNDGSTDRTEEEALVGGAVVLTHVTNLGKGGAMKTGAEYAIRQGADAIVFLDGDGQHDPAEIPLFLRKLARADIVIGARRFNKDMPAVRKFGKWLTGFIVNLLYDMKVSDCLNGFRAVRSSAYAQIVWRSTDYTVEAEMLAWAGKARLKYEEVVTKTIYHDTYKGVTLLHGFPIIWNLIMWRFHRRGK